MKKEFQTLYSKMYPKLVHQATFILGDRAAAEDMAQEALLRLHKIGISKINNPSAWLSKVTNNLCFSYMRKEGSRRRREEIVLKNRTEDDFSHVVASAENMALDREEFRLIHKALRKLQPRDRMVLLMKFSGYKYDEIAATVEVNRNSVGTILARARKKFKQEYERICPITQGR